MGFLQTRSTQSVQVSDARERSASTQSEQTAIRNVLSAKSASSKTIVIERSRFVPCSRFDEQNGNVPPLNRLLRGVQVMRRVASGRGGATHGLSSSSGVYRRGTAAQDSQS